MPIYEYRCGGCQRKFEQIVLRGRALEEAVCPRCGSHQVERLLSSFAVAGVSRKSEDSFDDDFDASDDALGDDLGGDDFSGEGMGAGDEGDLGLGDDGGDDDDEDF